MKITPLPPHIDPEHKKLIDDALQALEEYTAMLTAELLPEQKEGGCLAPKPRSTEEIIRARIALNNDFIRKEMIKLIGQMKMMYERPRFLVRNYVDPVSDAYSKKIMFNNNGGGKWHTS